jgi:hypothetical protein
MAIYPIILKENRENRYIKQGFKPEYVQFANEHFKPRDWFEYALKILTYGNFLKDLDENNAEEYEKTKMGNKIMKDFGIKSFDSFDNREIYYIRNQANDLFRKGRFFEEIMHYLSFEENQRFRQVELRNPDGTFKNPFDVEQELTQWERDRIDNLKERERSLDTGDTIIEFPDGWYWVRVDEPYCRREGDAMGHCGNTASYGYGDNILSLRDNHGAPWATFIDKGGEGYIGEMKGRFNKRPHHPTKDLNPYIVELLKSEHVVHLVGGGYQSHENFNFHEDLSWGEQQDVLDVKPYIIINLDVIEDIARKGDIEKAEKFFYDRYDGRIDIEVEGENVTFYLEKNVSVSDVIDNIKDDIPWVNVLQKIINIAENYDVYTVGDEAISFEDFIYWVQENHQELSQKMFDYVAKNTRDATVDGFDSSNLYDFMSTNELTLEYNRLYKVYTRIFREISQIKNVDNDDVIEYFKRVLQRLVTYCWFERHYQYAEISKDDEEKFHMVLETSSLYDEDEQYLNFSDWSTYPQEISDSMTMEKCFEEALDGIDEANVLRLKPIRDMYVENIGDIEEDSYDEDEFELLFKMGLQSNINSFESVEDAIAWYFFNAF